MNSRERRRLRRDRGEQGRVPPLSEERPREEKSTAKANPRLRLNKWRDFFSWVAHKTYWLLGALATVLSIWGFWPDISIEPYVSRDTRNPFGQQFYVQNSNRYSLYDVTPKCFVKEVESGSAQTGRFKFGNNVVQDESETLTTLEPGAKSNVSCELQKSTGLVYKTLRIGISVDYHAPLGIHRCKTADFNGVSANKDEYRWTYAGSSPCDAAISRIISGNR